MNFSLILNSHNIYNKKYNKKKNNFYEENYTILVFLSKIFNKFYKKRLDFDLTRLHSPVNDSLILAKLDTGVVTIYGLYIVLSMLSLILIVFGSIIFGFTIIDPRLLIILIFTSIMVLSQN